jgi:hypothetical protein
MMARLNPDLMQLDDGATGAPRVAGPRTDTSKISLAEAEAASMQAGTELGLTPEQLQEGITDASKLTKLSGETNTQFNARVVQGYKDLSPKPELTPEEEAAGFTIQFVRTGAGGKGEYRKIRPLKFNVAAANAASGNNGFIFDNGDGAVITYDANGNPIVTDANPISDDTRDAFATLQNLFTSYGLGSLASEIAGYMTSGLTASEALIKLKTNPSGAYAERFAGNFARTKKGLNVISEAAYIDLESSYAETLKAYGLGNMLSTDSKQNAKQFASYIENDISAIEFKDRIDTVQERVVNADPAIKAMFKEFYPSLTNSDLVSYFLNPTETIGKLKEKVTSAEIGAAFTGQGLTTSLAAASDFARYGIDRADALKGAANIAGVLPEATKLGNIYGETGVTYNQQTGEQEFLKSSDEAKRKRNLLASRERATFEGSAGNAPGAFSTSYLRKSSTAGLI